MSLFPPRESVVDVLLPVAVGSAYSYRVPEGMEVAPGDIVVVPLGPRMMLGCVWPRAENPKPVDPAKLKPIHRRYDVAPLSPAMLAFIRWIADYTVTPPGMVLRLALRHDESAGISRERTGVRLTEQRPQRRTAARERVIEALADGFVRAKSEAAREAGVSPSVVDGLVDDGVLETVVLPPEPAAERPDPDHSAPDLLPAQRDVADRSGRGGEGPRVPPLSHRRRHRLGQDRGLFRGGGGDDPAGPAGADPDAGNRPHPGLPRPLRPALRRQAGRMAFGRGHQAARAHLQGRVLRRGERGRRRALGAVPAVPRPRPRHRRRGARQRLQAGGRRPLPRPRHGGGAGAAGGGAGRPRSRRRPPSRPR